MAGTRITFKMDDLRRVLRKVYGRAKEPGPFLEVVGSIIQTSVHRNFEVGGRPERWAPLSPATARRRGATGPVLRRQGMAGGLMGSVNYQALGDRVLVGTNKVYGATHQFGAKKGQFGTVVAQVPAHERVTRHGTVRVRPHQRRQKVPWGDIPARPFLLVQDEDVVEIREAWGEYVLAP